MRRLQDLELPHQDVYMHQVVGLLMRKLQGGRRDLLSVLTRLSMGAR